MPEWRHLSAALRRARRPRSGASACASTSEGRTTTCGRARRTGRIFGVVHGEGARRKAAARSPRRRCRPSPVRGSCAWSLNGAGQRSNRRPTASGSLVGQGAPPRSLPVHRPPSGGGGADPRDPGDAGLDLVAVEGAHEPGQAPRSPTGWPWRSRGTRVVLPRSGLARCHGVTCNAPGLIDAGYRGELTVLMVNPGQEAVPGPRRRPDRPAGDRPGRRWRRRSRWTSCRPLDGRGEGGFGSTGGLAPAGRRLRRAIGRGVGRLLQGVVERRQGDGADRCGGRGPIGSRCRRSRGSSAAAGRGGRCRSPGR